MLCSSSLVGCSLWERWVCLWAATVVIILWLFLHESKIMCMPDYRHGLSAQKKSLIVSFSLCLFKEITIKQKKKNIEQTLNHNTEPHTERTAAPTWFPVLLRLSVEPADSLHQLPLLTAARVVDKVPGQDLLQLPDRQALDVPRAWEVRQWGSGPAACLRANLSMEVVNVHSKHESFKNSSLYFCDQPP